MTDGIRSSVAATETSFEPWPSARSILLPLAQRVSAPLRLTRPTPLAAEPAAAVMADRGVVDPVALEQPERLREIARRHEHLVAAAPQRLDHGPDDQHVRRVGEVDRDTRGRASGATRAQIVGG